MDVIESTAKGLIGLTEKAVIYVPSLEAIEYWKSMGNNTIVDPDETDGNSAIGDTNKKKDNVIKSMQAETEKKIREGAKATLDMSGDNLFGSEMATQAARKLPQDSLQEFKAYNKVGVQYNPKTLIITGLGGIARSYSSGLGAGAENQITQINNQTSLTLSCELVFTNVNISDAFMTEDLMNLNIESAASNVMNIADRAMGKSPSVQPMVDGFMSVVTTGYTRRIIFAWGSTVFSGELTRVECNYKMFNKRGDPIIATVNISIRQGFEGNQIVKDHWREQFEAVFKEQSSAQQIADQNLA